VGRWAEVVTRLKTSHCLSGTDMLCSFRALCTSQLSRLSAASAGAQLVEGDSSC
jgi:hypothetical protein